MYILFLSTTSSSRNKMLLLTIIICVVFYITYRYKKQNLKHKEWANNFKGPKPVPILGNYFELPSMDPVDIFQTLLGFHKTYGSNLVSWGLLNDVKLMVTNPKDVETILLAKSISKSKAYKFLEPWLGTGLLTSKDRKWFQRRRIITPTFHFQILEQFFDIFNRESNKLIHNLKSFVNQGDIDIYRNITLCALDVICETSMGVAINAQDDPNNEYVLAVKEMSTIIFNRFFSVYREFPRIFEYSRLARKQKRVLKILHNFTSSVITQRKRKLEIELNNNNNNAMDKENDEESEIYGKKRMSFLDLLLSATVDGKSLDFEAIREEVDTFMFEGHDTTTSGITMTLYHLSQNQDIQEKVFEEVRNIMGDDPKKSVGYNDLQEMKFLEMVIKETLRIHPPVPSIGRTLQEDTIIGNNFVPAGTEVYILIIALHTNENIYKNPHKFDPNRFTAEKQSKRGPYDYIPFSAGSRNCIGQKFAMLEMKSTISKMIRNYKLLPSDADKVFTYKVDLVLRPVNGVHLKIIPREYYN